MVDMAERFQLRFSELLPERYSNLTFKFRHTATQRTEASAHYFTTGLFGRYTANHVWYPQALDKDPILRFYKLCDKWRHEVDDNPNSLNELAKFKKTNDAVEMTKRVSRRLGLDEVLPYNDVHSMYIACTFETAWTPRIPSPWCSLFTKEDLEVLEYSEDLKYFWVDGYGYEINYKQACPAIGDMIQHLTNTTLPKAVFYFTHSGTLLKVLSFLNLYNDNKKLTADNFRQNKDRKWRVSKIDVFGTNLAFILYRCGDGDKVLTMHQERPVTLPGCPQGELCPLSRILELYGNSVHSCKFNEMCAYSVPS
uniref:Multiple inositol polyphosphate phosphatase 1 n=3 Tax=Clastoptera arizonana TaxID=38151 RepID=A0A1B6E9P5_9HEMI